MFEDFHLGWFAVGAAFFGRALIACAALERVPYLPRAIEGEKREVDAVVIADEVDGVAECLASLRAQTGVALRILLVDDRSPPDAAARLRVLAASHGVELVRIDAVPAGSLPFAHAITQALARSDRDEVLLLARPVVARVDDALGRALAALRTTRAAALWLIARVHAGWLTPLAVSSLADALPALAATQRDRDAPALPIDAALYRRAFLADALSQPDASAAPIVEFTLAQKALRDGVRIRVAHAALEFALARRSGLRDFAELSERTLASYGLRLWLAAAFATLYLACWIAAVLGPFDPNPWGLFAAGGLASTAVSGVLVARVQRHSSHGALVNGLLVPVVALIEASALAFVVARLAVRRGARWRGVFVPLSLLSRRP